MPEKHDDLDTAIKEATLARIRAEAEKARAEKDKVDVERIEIQREHSARWYARQSSRKAIVTGFLAVPVAWFYFSQIGLPLTRAEVIAKTLENAETTERLEVMEDSLIALQERARLDLLVMRDIQASLEAQNDTLLRRLAILEDQFDHLQESKSQLIADLRSASTRISNTERERDQMRQQADALEREFAMQSEVRARMIDSLQASVAQARNQSAALDSLIVAAANTALVRPEGRTFIDLMFGRSRADSTRGSN